MRIKLIQGDAIEQLRLLPADSCDLVFSSPPYEDARLYGINFRRKGQDWVDWMVEVWRECARVCTGLVAFVVEGRTRNFQWSATPALLMADLHRAGLKLRKPPAFCRVGIPGSGGPDWWRNDWEFICCTSRGKLPWSDNTACGHPPKWAPGGEMSHRIADGSRVRPSHRLGRGMANGIEGSTKGSCRGKRHVSSGHDANGEPITEVSYSPPVLANPGNLVHCLVGGGVMGDKECHENEAPFPEALADRFIRSFCPPNGLVVDPFSGSASTGAAAIKCGRRYLGIDLRENQVQLGEKRLRKFMPLFAT